jgi:cellobiose transport system substrate-binding protein
VADATDAYFGGAPIGRIFGAVAAALPVAILGPKDGQIRDAMNNGLLAIDTQGKDPDETWHATLRSVKNALGD